MAAVAAAEGMYSAEPEESAAAAAAAVAVKWHPAGPEKLADEPEHSDTLHVHDSPAVSPPEIPEKASQTPPPTSDAVFPAPHVQPGHRPSASQSRKAGENSLLKVESSRCDHDLDLRDGVRDRLGWSQKYVPGRGIARRTNGYLRAPTTRRVWTGYNQEGTIAAMGRRSWDLLARLRGVVREWCEEQEEGCWAGLCRVIQVIRKQAWEK